MASTIMHIAVADKLYKKLKDNINIDYYDFILGSIAPDVSKQIGLDKKISHFIRDNTSIPNLELFLDKYAGTLENSFNLGYFVHLYTDLIFYKDFLPLFIQDDILSSTVKYLNGNTLELTLDDRKNLLYNDYTNLNKQLIDYYNLNLDIFYTEYIKPTTDIIECDINNLDVLIDNMSILIESSNSDKDYIIDISRIITFIDDSINQIYDFFMTLELI